MCIMESSPTLGVGDGTVRGYTRDSTLHPYPVSRKVPLAITPRVSLARILNTLGNDFENVAEEEEKRQHDLRALREWSMQVLGWPLHTRPVGAWA